MPKHDDSKRTPAAKLRAQQLRAQRRAKYASTALLSPGAAVSTPYQPSATVRHRY